MKFDIQKPETSNQKPDLGLSEQEKLFIAGSTHRGEENIVLDVYKNLLKGCPNLRLLIAPRHIERVPEIEKLISSFGFNSQRVSQLGLSRRTTNNELRTILVLDTIGQLKHQYALADIVFIGGSLIPHGGQNPIEAAVFSKPILFGSYMSNFLTTAEFFLNKKAAIMVKDAQQLRDTCSKLLQQPEYGKELGRRAKEVIQENTGATFRNMELIKQFL